MTHRNYIKKHHHHVLMAVKKTPLFASVVMAQAILESADAYGEPGKNFPARLGNNHFGACATDDWMGIRIYPKFGPGHLKLPYIPLSYRCYPDAQQSFCEHVQRLIEHPNCRKAGVFSARTPQEQAKALQRAVVRGRPHYARTLVRLIKKYELYFLDWCSGHEGLTAMSKATALPIFETLSLNSTVR